jgi:hypothetical protein
MGGPVTRVRTHAQRSARLQSSRLDYQVSQIDAVLFHKLADPD